MNTSTGLEIKFSPGAVQFTSYGCVCVFNRTKTVQEAVRSGYRAAYATDNWKRRHSGPGVNGKLADAI